MRNSKTRDMAAVFSSSSEGLQHLVRRSQQLAVLSQSLRELLGAPLGGHCEVANLRNGVLVVHVDSAAWATRLRFQMPAILPQLTRLPGQARIRSFQLRVRPGLSDSQLPTRRQSVVAARDVRPSTDLQQALGRLSRRFTGRR